MPRDALAVIIAVSMVSAIGGLVFNTMPLLLSAAKTDFDMGPAQLGSLSFMAGIGYLLGTLTAPLWVDRVNWRLTAFAIILAVICVCLTMSQVSSRALFVGFIGYGFFCALAIALAMRILADMPDPERAYGTRLSVELVSIGAFLSILPIIFIAKFGFSGAMLGLACMAGLLGLGALLCPPKTSTIDVATRISFPTWQRAHISWKILIIFTLYLLANVGLYFFLAVIAQKFEPSQEQFSLMFGVLKWLGGVAGALGAIIGARAGLRVPHYAAMIILIIGVAGLLLAQNFTQFMIASWVWEFGFTLGCLYQTAAIVRFDRSNKLVMLVPMGFGISTMLGGRIAGQMLEGGTVHGLYIWVVVSSLLPSIFILCSSMEPPLQAAND